CSPPPCYLPQRRFSTRFSRQLPTGIASIYHDSPDGAAGSVSPHGTRSLFFASWKIYRRGNCTPDGRTRVTCDEIRNLFDSWYDGELDAPRSAALERHLEECPGCSALSNARSALSEVLVEG